MKFLFIVEDHFGKPFFSKFFHKKLSEGFFSGSLVNVLSIIPGPKISRLIGANIGNVDRIIIIADADGGNLEEKKQNVLSFVKYDHVEHVKVVLLDHEIEEWICYSEGIEFGDQKPSKVLKYRKNYQKRQLPRYADKLDCKTLQSHPSFMRLASSLKPDS